jgi:small conductance mechanosensitive channel
LNPLFIKLFEAATTEVETTTEAVATSTSATAVEELSKITWADIWNKILDWSMNQGIRLLIAIVVWFVSFKLINFIFKRIARRLARKKADATLSKVLVNIGRIAVKILVMIGLIAYVGIETASLSALVLAIGTGISLALQGTLSNFAGGVIIIVMRPFKLGDFITSNGESGTVEDIKLFYTYITTPDNRVVMIPNGSLANNVIVNASAKDTRRVDVVMSISYGADVELAKRLAKEVCGNNEKIFATPAPFAEVGEYGDSSVDIFVRCWCKRQDYWDTKFYMLREIKNVFDQNGIEIPFNQLDINFRNALPEAKEDK